MMSRHILEKRLGSDENKNQEPMSVLKADTTEENTT